MAIGSDLAHSFPCLCRGHPTNLLAIDSLERDAQLFLQLPKAHYAAPNRPRRILISPTRWGNLICWVTCRNSFALISTKNKIKHLLLHTVHLRNFEAAVRRNSEKTEISLTIAWALPTATCWE